MEELGVIRKCISSDSQVSLMQKQVVDDSGKLASVYSKQESSFHRAPRGSNVIDDTNYHVTTHFKTLISEHAALAHLLYTHTFIQGLCHPPVLSNVRCCVLQASYPHRHVYPCLLAASSLSPIL